MLYTIASVIVILVFGPAALGTVGGIVYGLTKTLWASHVYVLKDSGVFVGGMIVLSFWVTVIMPFVLR
jgi:hypothetical protein